MKKEVNTNRVRRVDRGSESQTSSGRRTGRGHQRPHHLGGQHATRSTRCRPYPFRTTFHVWRPKPAGTSTAIIAKSSRSPEVRNSPYASTVQIVSQRMAHVPKVA